jgi:hypothetical protein
VNEEPYNYSTGNGFNGALYDYLFSTYPGVKTAVGTAFRDYTQALTPCPTLQGSVQLQRPGTSTPHSSWQGPLRLTVFGTPHWLSTDASGHFSYRLPAGTYDLQVKGIHSLSVLRSGVVIPGSGAAVDFCTLMEGDASGDDRVAGADFSILASSYGLSAGDAGFDPRADFNNDGKVSGLDFSLLATNYDSSGPLTCP